MVVLVVVFSTGVSEDEGVFEPLACNFTALSPEMKNNINYRWYFKAYSVYTCGCFVVRAADAARARFGDTVRAIRIGAVQIIGLRGSERLDGDGNAGGSGRGDDGARARYARHPLAVVRVDSVHLKKRAPLLFV